MRAIDHRQGGGTRPSEQKRAVYILSKEDKTRNKESKEKIKIKTPDVCQSPLGRLLACLLFPVICFFCSIYL